MGPYWCEYLDRYRAELTSGLLLPASLTTSIDVLSVVLRDVAARDRSVWQRAAGYPGESFAEAVVRLKEVCASSVVLVSNTSVCGRVCCSHASARRFSHPYLHERPQRGPHAPVLPRRLPPRSDTVCTAWYGLCCA
jgi:hypothetical protein